jgi:SAM-dependent methyltransferase
MNARNEDEWWKSFHVPEMASLFLQRGNAAELEETIAFLLGELGLRPGDRVYDQCCGTGALSLELAARGVSAVGADLCDDYVRRAKQVAAEKGADCDFHLADAFEFVPTRPCHGAFNWYSSFGYSHCDGRNQQMFHRAYEALLPGGRFAVDVPHLPGLLRGFQKHMVRHGQADGREILLVRESRINLRDGLLEQLWSWHVEGRELRQRRSALRLYLPHQIADMLEACGFDDIRLFGSIRSEELGLDSPRLICTGRRPDR